MRHSRTAIEWQALEAEYWILKGMVRRGYYQQARLDELEIEFGRRAKR